MHQRSGTSNMAQRSRTNNFKANLTPSFKDGYDPVETEVVNNTTKLRNNDIVKLRNDGISDSSSSFVDRISWDNSSVKGSLCINYVLIVLQL